MHRSRAWAAIAVVGTLTLTSAGCGDDDEEASSGSGAGSSAATTAAPAAAPAELAIAFAETAGGAGKLTVPAEAKAGITKITLANGGKKPHEAQFVRVEGDHTVAEVVEAVTGDGDKIPDWIGGGGGVGRVAPGATGTAVQDLPAGRYVVLDDPGEEGGKPATAELDVAAGDGASTAALPETTATITGDEYRFETAGLKAGKNQVRFVNAGKELHHAILFPYAKGATLAQVKKAFASEEGGDGPPPVDFEAAVHTTVIDGGVEQVVDLDLKKGKYAVVCFITDRAGGPPHVAKGMLAEVDVP